MAPTSRYCQHTLQRKTGPRVTKTPDHSTKEQESQAWKAGWVSQAWFLPPPGSLPGFVLNWTPGPLSAFLPSINIGNKMCLGAPYPQPPQAEPRANHMEAALPPQSQVTQQEPRGRHHGSLYSKKFTGPADCKGDLEWTEFGRQT